MRIDIPLALWYNVVARQHQSSGGMPMCNIIPQFCPKCNYSRKFYRYGKDKFGNQKYQCLSCKHQFAPDYFPPDNIGRGRPKFRNYPRCPKCGKASFLHHDYPTHSNFRCSEKRCYHSFFEAKAYDPPPQLASALGKTDLMRMRHSAHIIFTVLSMYFFGKDSFRNISLLLLRLYNIKLSHVTVSKWCVKFAPIFHNLNLDFLPHMNFDSDEWHADETVIKIRGQKHYLWFVIDSETRFVLGFFLGDRSSSSAHSMMSQVKTLGNPLAAVTDRYDAYVMAIKTYLPNAQHIQVEDFNADIPNNLIESFNKTFKSWYKTKCGFDSYINALSLISVFVFFYNYLRPHSSLSKLTPAQVAGLRYNPNPKNIFAKSTYRLSR